MSTIPNYHRQPATLDPTKEPPDEDAPLAQGHDSDDRGDVRERHDEHKAQVEAEADQDEVTARAPGDHAQKSKPAAKRKADDD